MFKLVQDLQTPQNNLVSEQEPQLFSFQTKK